LEKEKKRGKKRVYQIRNIVNAPLEGGKRKGGGKKREIF